MEAELQPHFSEALGLYLKKHRGKDAKFAADVSRVFDSAKSVIGDPALASIKRADARRVLDSMLSKNLKTASVKRNLAVLSAIFNVAILELELQIKNPFSSLEIPGLLEDARTIPSFTDAELHQIAEAGLDEKSDASLIATMQIELGARVSEIALLRVTDIHLTEPIPYIEIKEHREFGRRLKTPGSARALPLLGCSLAAAQLAMKTTSGNGWLFERGRRNASIMTNRWLSRTLGGKRRSHSSRHSMESRLILARTDQRLTDTILGHKTGGIGSVYFSGYALSDLAAALSRIALN